MKKLRVGVLFGGRSGEHEVSLLSAASVLQAIDKQKYEVVPIGITKDGRWLTAGDAENLLHGKLVLEARHLRAGDPELTEPAAVLARGEAVLVPPEPVHRQTGLMPFQTDAPLTRRASDRAINVDVIFPVLHGTFGEDGTIQGLLELADIPYVGAGVLGSAAGMDKDIMKSLFIAAGIPVCKHVTVLRSAWEKDSKKVYKLVESQLKYPLFVKPANLGSSVGISKAHDHKELGPAMDEAARFDRKALAARNTRLERSNARFWVTMNPRPRCPAKLFRSKNFTTTTPSILTKVLS
jgi:D-alanine-D-alanine ligase